MIVYIGCDCFVLSISQQVEGKSKAFMRDLMSKQVLVSDLCKQRTLSGRHLSVANKDFAANFCRNFRLLEVQLLTEASNNNSWLEHIIGRIEHNSHFCHSLQPDDRSQSGN